ncbi:hypothetical protein GQX74_007946 [Glossina fuscipes]|nr:hypothetical protein GQX74_007946 [Glossina fuscipes]
MLPGSSSLNERRQSDSCFRENIVYFGTSNRGLEECIVQKLFVLDRHNLKQNMFYHLVRVKIPDENFPNARKQLALHPTIGILKNDNELRTLLKTRYSTPSNALNALNTEHTLLERTAIYIRTPMDNAWHALCKCYDILQNVNLYVSGKSVRLQSYHNNNVSCAYSQYRILLPILASASSETKVIAKPLVPNRPARATRCKAKIRPGVPTTICGVTFFKIVLRA